MITNKMIQTIQVRCDETNKWINHGPPWPDSSNSPLFAECPKKSVRVFIHLDGHGYVFAPPSLVVGRPAVHVSWWPAYDPCGYSRIRRKCLKSVWQYQFVITEQAFTLHKASREKNIWMTMGNTWICIYHGLLWQSTCCMYNCMPSSVTKLWPDMPYYAIISQLIANKGTVLFWSSYV